MDAVRRFQIGASRQLDGSLLDARPRCTSSALFFVASLIAVTASTARAEDSTPAVPPLVADHYRIASERLIGAALASDHAWLRLSQLCDGIGNRITGSRELERAVAWAAAAMREDGLERVRLQPVHVPHWVRGKERAEMVEPGPQRLEILGLGRSVATPPGGITADVVAVRSFGELDSLPAEAVRGRIVLYDVPFTTYGETVRYRSDGARRAAARGAVAALVRSVGPVSLRTPHTGAMSDSLPHIPAAAVTIEDAAMIRRLLERGERVRVHLEMGARTLPDALSHNVIGELRGRERPDEVVRGRRTPRLLGRRAGRARRRRRLRDQPGGAAAHEAARPQPAAHRALRAVDQRGERRQGRQGLRRFARAPERHVAAIESDGGVERPVGFGFDDSPRSRRLAPTRRAVSAGRAHARIAPLSPGSAPTASTPTAAAPTSGR